MTLDLGRAKKYTELILIILVIVFLGVRVIGKYFSVEDRGEVVKTFPIEKITRVCVKGDIEEAIELDGSMVKISLVKDNAKNGREGMALIIETRTK